VSVQTFDPYVERTERRIRVRLEDVRTDLLEASDTVTICPYQGQARYWSLKVGDVRVPDAVWNYPDPIPENPKIRDLLWFFNERADLVVDGQRLERPDSPWSNPGPERRRPTPALAMT
jgi:uncharacterized protein (DUF427 family)